MLNNARQLIVISSFVHNSFQSKRNQPIQILPLPNCTLSFVPPMSVDVDRPCATANGWSTAAICRASSRVGDIIRAPRPVLI